jgi:hypothetical protein
VRAGGALGIAGSVIGLMAFGVACAGFGAVYSLSPLPVLLGAVGLILVIVGATTQQVNGVEDTHVLAALFVTIFSVLGGLLLMGLWLAWPILPR